MLLSTFVAVPFFAFTCPAQIDNGTPVMAHMLANGGSLPGIPFAITKDISVSRLFREQCDVGGIRRAMYRGLTLQSNLGEKGEVCTNENHINVYKVCGGKAVHILDIIAKWGGLDSNKLRNLHLRINVSARPLD
jgi:hypothetical protein